MMQASFIQGNGPPSVAAQEANPTATSAELPHGLFKVSTADLINTQPFSPHSFGGSGIEYSRYSSHPVGNLTFTGTVEFTPIYTLVPFGDPTQAQVEDQDQFTYDTHGDSLLQMSARFAPVTDSEVALWIAPLLNWTVTPSPPSGVTPNWSFKGGAPNTGSGLGPTTYSQTNLPSKNVDFGDHDVSVTMNLNGSAVTVSDNTARFLFSQTETDNPASTSSSPIPNWFYYWSQAINKCGGAYYGGDMPPIPPYTAKTLAVTPALTTWSYNGPSSVPNGKDFYVFGTVVAVPYNLSGVCPEQALAGLSWKGIDALQAVCAHESRHVQQAVVANALVAGEPARCASQIAAFSSTTPNLCGSYGPWQYGWSFSPYLSPGKPIVPSNHWTAGPTCLPGIPGADDDSDGFIDDLNQFPSNNPGSVFAFELGVGLSAGNTLDKNIQLDAAQLFSGGLGAVAYGQQDPALFARDFPESTQSIQVLGSITCTDPSMCCGAPTAPSALEDDAYWFEAANAPSPDQDLHMMDWSNPGFQASNQP